MSQKGVGKLEMPNWGPGEPEKVRNALLVLTETLPELRRAGGRRAEVDPLRHLIATASGWGLNPDKDAIYLNVTPVRNDSTTVSVSTRELRGEIREGTLAGALLWSLSAATARQRQPLFRPERLVWYSTRVDRAKEMMEARHAEPFSLSTMARESGLSVFHFARIFADSKAVPCTAS